MVAATVWLNEMPVFQREITIIIIVITTFSIKKSSNKTSLRYTHLLLAPNLTLEQSVFSGSYKSRFTRNIFSHI
jgi:hypothetical protein